MDNIKQLNFTFENCEGIIIPYTCFNKLEINGSKDLSGLKENDKIISMKCDIVDSGRMSYSFDCGSNKVSPIDRLAQYADICHVRIIHNDDTEVHLVIEWYDEGDYNWSENNKNQINSEETYNTIHIEIKPYIKLFTIQEVFKFPVGTIVEMIDNGVFIISECKNNKCFQDVQITEYLVNGMYRIV